MSPDTVADLHNSSSVPTATESLPNTPQNWSYWCSGIEWTISIVASILPMLRVWPILDVIAHWQADGLYNSEDSHPLRVRFVAGAL